MAGKTDLQEIITTINVYSDILISWLTLLQYKVNIQEDILATAPKQSHVSYMIRRTLEG